MPSFCSLTPTTFVSSSTASQIFSMRFASTATRSRSAPGSRPGIISTTVTLRAERRVDAAQLETDVAAADHQQRLRHVLEIERAGRVHDARAVEAEHRHLRGLRADGDDGVTEGDLLGAAIEQRDLEAGRTEERRRAAEVLDLACLRPAVRCRWSAALTTRVLEAAELVDVDLRGAERTPHDGRARLRQSPWRRAAAPSTGCSRDRRRRRPDSARDR